MIPGATPTHTFTVPVDTNIIKALRITYSQGNSVVLQKTHEQCKMMDGEIICKLSQEDTLAFSDSGTVRVQLKIKTDSGDVLISKIKSMPVQAVLEKEAI